MKDVCPPSHPPHAQTARPEVKLLKHPLRAWCEQEHGRRVQIAKQLGTSRQRISDWLAGRKSPTLEQGLLLQAFLKKQRRAKSRARPLRSVHNM
jgi:DNA-binding transcriptional regulator YiaG